MEIQIMDYINTLDNLFSDSIEVAIEINNMMYGKNRADFIEKSKGYKEMSQIDYIKKYCDNKYRNFNLPIAYFEQTCFYDITYYVDDDRKIVVVDRFNIGD